MFSTLVSDVEILVTIRQGSFHAQLKIIECRRNHISDSEQSLA